MVKVTRGALVFAVALSAAEACTSFGTIDAGSGPEDATLVDDSNADSSGPIADARDEKREPLCSTLWSTIFKRPTGLDGWQLFGQGGPLQVGFADVEVDAGGLAVTRDAGMDAGDAAPGVPFAAAQRTIEAPPAAGTARIVFDFGPVSGAAANTSFTAVQVLNVLSTEAGSPRAVQVRWLPPSTIAVVSGVNTAQLASFSGIEPTSTTRVTLELRADESLAVIVAGRPPQKVQLPSLKVSSSALQLSANFNLGQLPNGPLAVRFHYARLDHCREP